MNQLEKEIQKYSMKFGDLSYKPFDINQFLEQYEIEYFSKGSFSKVYKVVGHEWVIKEGRWNLEVNIWGDIFVPLPGKAMENIFEQSNFTMLPTLDEIKKQFKEYEDAIKYFAVFSEEDVNKNPDLKPIRDEQLYIRKNIVTNVKKYEKEYNLTIDEKIYDILESDLLYYSFFPREYTVLGKSFSEENEGKDTYFIFQQLIKGKRLAEYRIQKMNEHHRKLLALFAYLLLVMKKEAKLLLDTKPHNFLTTFTNWLFNTDNIIVSGDDIKFIDTRWMWRTDSSIIKRGLIIPDLITLNAKFYINSLLKGI